MKKIITFCAIIACALSAKAQFPATSEQLYFTISKTDWAEVTDFTDGVVNDSIRGIIYLGKKFQRKDLNSTIFNAHSVGIRANGTDQAALINKLLSRTYVSGLIMDVPGGGKITVNGNISAGGRTLYFNGGTYLGGNGGDTLKLATIVAPETVKIFDTTIRIDSLSRTGNGRVSPMWWGAKGDGSTDDLIPLRISAAARGCTWYLPPGFEFKATDSIAVHYSNDVDQHSPLRFFTNLKKGLILGTRTYDYTYVGKATVKYYNGLDVRRATQGAWTDSLDWHNPSAKPLDIGIELINLQGCFVNIKTVLGFTCNVHLVGINAGNVHNSIELGLIMNGKYALWANREGTGWYNSNLINKGWITVNTGINTSLARYGYIMGDPGDTYNHNNNEWKNPSFELNSDTKGFPIVMNNAIGNLVEGARTEGNNKQTVVFMGNAERNIVIAGFSLDGTKKLDTSTLGTNVYIDSRDRTRMGADAYTVFKWAATNNTSSFSSTNVNVRGIGLYNSTGQPVVSRAATDLGIYPDFVELRSANASLGIEVNTQTTKEFLIKHTTTDGKTGRVLVTLYDSLGNDLGTIENRPKLSPSAPAYTPSYGTGWISGINSDRDYVLAVNDKVWRVKIRIVRASDVVRLKSISIHVIAPSENDVTPILGDGLNKEYNLSTVAPIYFGTYVVNRIIYNSVPIEGSTQYWVCDTAGTARNLTTGSISMTSGNAYGLVTGVSLDSVYANEYVRINSNTYRVTRKNADSLFFSPNAAGTYSGTFNFAQPTFTAAGDGGGGGGGGSVVLTGPVTGSGIGSVATSITDNAITYAKIQQAAGLSVIARSANSTGNLAEVTAATNGHILFRNGTSLAFGKPDLVTSITTSLSGYLKAAASSFTASATVPYSDISGLPNVFFKNSANTGDSIFYMDADTLKAKRIDVASTNSIVRTRTVVGDKITYSFALSGDAASPGNNKKYATDGSGVKGWYDDGGGVGGGVSSVGLLLGSSGSDANVSGSPITSSGSFTLNLPTASAAIRGLLSSSNWTTFNNKANGTTTLTINGTTYNLTANRTWNVGTVTSVGLSVGTSGTDINVGGSPISVAGILNINIPTASAANRGALSAADWSAFNAKVATSRTITINGVTQNLSANRTWTITEPSMAANSVKVNATTGSNIPTDLALANNQMLGRGSSGNLSAITLGPNLYMTGNQLNASYTGIGGEYVPLLQSSSPAPSAYTLDTLSYKVNADVVSISGRFLATVSTTGDQYYALTLPPGYVCAFTDEGQLGGGGSAKLSTSSKVPVFVYASAAPTGAIILEFNSSVTGPCQISFICQYKLRAGGD